MLSILVVAPLLPAAVIAPDPLAEAMAALDEANPPEIIRHIGTVESGEGAARIETRRFTYRSRGDANIVFAILARPVAAAAPRTRPGLLFFHGGSSSAEDKAALVEDYARRGYVALACDLPGICDPAKALHSTGAWRTAFGGEMPRLAVVPGAVKSPLVDGIVAAIDGFRLMRSLPDVDPTRIGLTGQSWGGYTTVIVAGLLGDRVKAAYSLWGCGYFELGSHWTAPLGRLSPDARDTWLTWLDAGRRAPGIAAPLFIEGATNDTYFWPPAVEATLAAAPGDTNRVWWANLDHSIERSIPTRRLFLDYHLKGEGRPFAKLSILAAGRAPDGGLIVKIKAMAPDGVAIGSVRLFHSQAEAVWKKRVWASVEAQPSGDDYVALLPAEAASEGTFYYAHLTDSRGLSVSGAITGIGASPSAPVR